MAYTPVSGVVPQFARNAGGASASGYYLKGYAAGTTTPLSMGVDSTPTFTLAKCALNTRGEPISNDADDDSVFIPHFNALYKLVLYINSTDADNNTTANAVWVVDNISGQFDATQITYRSNTTVTQFLDNSTVDSYAALKALTIAQVNNNDIVKVCYRASEGDGGHGDFRWDSSDNSANVTADPGEGIYVAPDSDATGANGCWVRRIENNTVSLDMFGLDNTWATDVVNILESILSLGYKIRQSGGSFLIDSTWTLINNVDIELTDGAEFLRTSDNRIVAGDNTDTTAITATADLPIDGTTITLDASGYAAVSVGTRLKMESNVTVNPDYIDDFVATPNDLDDWVYQVQVVEVKEKLGSNQIQITNAARLPYPFNSGTATVKILNDTVENVKLKCKFRNSIGSPLASTEAAWINGRCLFGLDLEGAEFHLNNESPGVYLTLGRMKSIKHAKFYDGRNLDIFLRQACPNSELCDAEFYNHRTNDASIFVEAHNYNIPICRNKFDTAYWDKTSSVISAIQLDAKVTGCTVIGNTVMGYPVGVRTELGSMGNAIIGNTFELCEVSGIRMVESRSNTVSHNTFIDCGLSNTAHSTFSQQQGGVFVDNCESCVINDNTMLWVNPTFPNAMSGLKGDMNNGSFCGNTVDGPRQCVTLTGGSGNKINNNPLLRNDPDNSVAKVVLLTGSSTHYNEVKDNYIVGNDGVSSVGVAIESGSEGNEVMSNRFEDVADQIVLASTTNYQSIKDNYGEGDAIGANISAPQGPSNATPLRGFKIYSVRTEDAVASGNRVWEYKTDVGGGTPNRFRLIDLSSLESTVDV